MVGKGIGSRLVGLAAEAARWLKAWLAEKAVDLPGPIGRVLRGILTDGWALGTQAASEVLGVVGIVDWASWDPGDEIAAARLLGPSGGGEGLRALLDEAKVTIGSIVDTRLDQLGRVLADSVGQGEAGHTLAKRLRTVLDDPTQAETVAVTETARAIGAATQARYAANGIDKNEWLVSPDDRVCPICRGNEHEGPVPTGDRFPSGVPYPPAHPRCRCALLPDLGIDLDKATKADHNALRDYWLHGEGAARWSTWTELYQQLRRHVADERAKRIAAQWYHDRYGRWPGSHRRRDRNSSRKGPG